MKKYIKIAAVALSALVTYSCSEDDSAELDYITFEDSSYEFGVDLDGSNTNTIMVYAGNVSGSDRTFSIAVDESSTADPSSYSVPSTVTIPGGDNVGSFDVTISDVNIGPDGKSLVLDFVNEGAQYFGEDITLNVFQVCDAPVVVSLTFDDYASEISWEVLDATDTVIVSGGSYDDGDASASKQFCISPGDYTFVAYDAYGDGLAAPGEIVVSQGATALGTVNGEFGSEGATLGGDPVSFDFTVQ